MAPSVLRKLVTLQNQRMAEIKFTLLRIREKPRDSLTKRIVQSRIDAINKIWAEARKTHADIITRDDVENNDYVTGGIFEIIQGTYEDTLDEFSDLLTAVSQLDHESSARNRDENLADNGPRPAKLPKLDLPTFSGRFEDWENFCDLYTSLVHNAPRIADATKLQYLKSCLTDAAAELVKDVTITNANYASTWQALKNRFYNPRITVNNHLRALMNIPQLKRGNAEELRSFADEVQRIVRALSNLNMPVQSCDFILIFLISNRLDPESRVLWESELSASDQIVIDDAVANEMTLDPLSRFPKFADLAKFLEKRARALNIIAADLNNEPKSSTSVKSASKGKKVFHASHTQAHKKSTPKKCAFCAESHSLHNCHKFRDNSVENRSNAVRKLNLCFNCLGNHRVRDCTSKGRCFVCREKHHSLLHRSAAPPFVPKGEKEQPAQSSNKVTALTAKLIAPKYKIVLATAQVVLIGPNGDQARVRVLLDQGSEASFITEAIAQLLKLPKRPVNIALSGLGATTTGSARATTVLNVQSIANPSFQIKTDAFVLSKLTSRLPSRPVMEIDVAEFNKLTLADPHFYLPDSIDVILGADIYGELLKPGLKQWPSHKLTAQNTVFGWVISGKVDRAAPRRADSGSQAQVTIFHCATEDVIQRDLRKFWELEEISFDNKKLHPDDESCENLFRETHSRDKDGRYIVRLPLKSDPPKVALETRRIAGKSLENLHRRFSRDPKLESAYCEFMQTYEQLGHMSRVPSSELINPGAWYLPHHGVIQSSPTQWKLRVVFDASRRTHDQHSLNKFLLPGPALQRDLSLILLNWRNYRYVFTADIVKMFRQIQMHPHDQDYQRILWSSRTDDTPVEYRLTTVTYGTASAPYLAIRTLTQLANDERHRFPLGAQCLDNNTYVDDFFCGADDVQTAIKQRDELVKILATAGIELDKWAANHRELLPERSELTDQPKDIGTDDSVKTLGVHWSPSTDDFGFHTFDLEYAERASTKRAVLSCISRLFDPLGWLAPITVTAKVIMQDLWIVKCDWDAPLPAEIRTRWLEYCHSLANLPRLAIARWLGTSQNRIGQLHGFSDASSRAYAAAVYLRYEDENGRVQVSLLAAKTKVAPVKTVSIPNLELCGAALLVKLLRRVQNLDFLKTNSIFTWTDSQIVLTWLRKHPCHWKTFIANRVSYIQTELPSAIWGHVPTKENPADLGTRGSSAEDLSSCDLWWHGPTWLSRSAEDWPQTTVAPQNLHAQVEQNEPELLTRFSSLDRLTRVVAYCKRPLRNLRRGKTNLPPCTSFLTSSELSDARDTVIRVAQSFAFGTELRLLQSGQPLPIKNPLRKLNPFVEKETGLLRVGGRLINSTLSHAQKHPPILPHRCALSTLFARHAHVMCLHGGPTLTLNILQQNVWVLGRNRIIKTVIRNCVNCQRAKPRLAHQLMGNLPATRVNPARPFSSTGLDYAGPVQIRTTKGRGHRSYKGYIALFVCFATRAIHLELVSDLTTSSFISAYRRFVGRRGICQQLYSDNATTFHGADKELKDMFNEASDFYKNTATTLAKDGTEWSFIPPNAPHYGGLWEAGVKSTKHHLKRIIGDRTLTFEEMTTLLVEIEACLNSRPICSMKSDIDDLDVLTPAHFLIGTASALVPDSRLPEIPENRLNRFQLIKRLRDQFWKRWSIEYLQHLQERNKWRSPVENFVEGQIVLLRDDRYPPTKWPLGRIIEVHPGPDGLVRVVTVRTASNTLRRHIARIAPLLPKED